MRARDLRGYGPVGTNGPVAPTIRSSVDDLRRRAETAEAELTRLRQANAALKAADESMQQANYELHQQLAASQQANAALAKDAARYRRLRVLDEQASNAVTRWGASGDPEMLDAAIDAALEGQPHD